MNRPQPHGGPRWLGAGVGYRRPWRDALLNLGPGPGRSVLEIIPEHFLGDPEGLDALARRWPLVFHGIGMSLGTAHGPAREILAAREAAIVELAQRARPALITDHLAMTVSPEGVDLGHLGPLWFTEAALEVAIERVEHLQAIMPAPVAVEVIASPWVMPLSDYTEEEFAHALVEATGCGLLLDVSNLVVNGRNQGFDAMARLDAWPLESVWQVHLAGGMQGPDGWWIDHHGAPVEPESYRLLSALRGRAPLMCAIVERDAHLPPLDTITAEAEVAERIWAEVIRGGADAP